MQTTIHILPTIIYSDTNAISNRCEISEFYRVPHARFGMTLARDLLLYSLQKYIKYPYLQITEP